MKHKNKVQKSLSILTIILGIIVTICGVAIPVTHSLIPVELTKILLYTFVIAFALIVFLLLLKMLFAPQPLVKLAILPVTFTLTATFIAIYNIQAHMFFLQILSNITPEEYAAVTHDTSKMLSPIFMNLGIWIAATPMFIYGIMKAIKLRKGTPNNFDDYIQGKGRIVNMIDTRTKIQHRRVYKVQIEINTYGTLDIVEKELIIPQHIIYIFSINSMLDLFIDPNNDKKIFINTAYGIFQKNSMELD
jgi:hypothetical protein